MVLSENTVTSRKGYRRNVMDLEEAVGRWILVFHWR